MAITPRADLHGGASSVLEVSTCTMLSASAAARKRVSDNFMTEILRDTRSSFRLNCFAAIALMIVSSFCCSVLSAQATYTVKLGTNSRRSTTICFNFENTSFIILRIKGVLRTIRASRFLTIPSMTRMRLSHILACNTIAGTTSNLFVGHAF